MPPLDPACVVYAPVVSWLVDLFKRVPFLRDYPKIVAALLSFIAPYIAGTILGPLPVGSLIICALTTLVGATFVHEWVSKPLDIDDALAGRKK